MGWIFDGEWGRWHLRLERLRLQATGDRIDCKLLPWVRMARLSLWIGLLFVCGCASPNRAAGDLWLRGASQLIGEFGGGLLEGQDEKRGSEYRGVEMLLGLRSLQESSFGRVRHPGAFGMQVLLPIEGLPVAIELGGHYSQDDDGRHGGLATRGGQIFEGSVGLRLAFNAERGLVVPYVGCGLNALYANLDDRFLNRSTSDFSAGYYVHAGVLVYVGGNSYVGLDWRGVDGTDVSLLNGDDTLDYHQLSIVLGRSW